MRKFHSNSDSSFFAIRMAVSSSTASIRLYTAGLYVAITNKIYHMIMRMMRME